MPNEFNVKLYNTYVQRRAELVADPVLQGDALLRSIVMRDIARHCLDSLRDCRPLPLP